MIRSKNSPRSQRKYRLHPLIYTLLESTLAQDVEKKKAEPKLRSSLKMNRISFRAIGGYPTRFCTPCYRASEGLPLRSVSHKNRLQIGSSYTENKAFSLPLILDC